VSPRAFPRLLAAALGVGLTSSLLLPVSAGAATRAPADAASAGPTAGATAAANNTRNAKVKHTSWSLSDEFRTGKRQRVKVAHGALTLRNPKPRRHQGGTYDSGVWTSPWVTSGFAFSDLIPSWEATTTGDSLVRVRVRARGANGKVGSWDTVADWSLDNPRLARTTRSGQNDDLGRVNVDTWQATSAVTAWQVRIVLMRARGTSGKVSVERIGAVASTRYGAGATSKPGKVAGTVLEVPKLSQMTHKGHLPQYGGGGEAWCSPTSTAMVLAFHGHRPTPVGVNSHTNAVVDHTARLVYDHGYRGTGNWAFNTAYAATHAGGDSYVTRLKGLRQAEKFIADGVPLVLSIAFRKGELKNSPLTSSNGHLVVLVGFDKAGNPVVNDPAAPRNKGVRRTYDRGQLERAWLNASSGTTYVIRNR
jgi:uncharacterized protein YvpB